MLNRKVAAIVVALGVVLGTSACTFQSPVASTKVYDPSDGVNATVGKSHLRNFIYLVTTSGQGALIGSIVNQEVDAQDITVDLEANGGTGQVGVPVKAGEKLDMGYNGGQAVPLGVTTKAGQLVKVVAKVGSESITLNVPVLDGTFAEYAPIVAQLNAELVPGK